jgi:nickel/cobalt transporter (NicO) family protein
VLLLSTALMLGFLHGLGADHLMGIAALSLGTAGTTVAGHRSRTLSIAVRFAVGHALLLVLGAGALVVLGWSLPLSFERGGEVLGGVLLIVLGGVGLWGVGTGRVYAHAHSHVHADIQPAWHLHIGNRDGHLLATAHSQLPTIVGAAFAVSSLRALTLLAPFGDSVRSASLPMLLVLILVFAVGILISMSLFGVAFASVISARIGARLGQFAAAATAIASIALGAFWLINP